MFNREGGMADIQITCPGCGARFTVSEYISEKDQVCSQCGTAFHVVRSEHPRGLALKRPEAHPLPAPSMTDSQVSAVPPPLPQARAEADGRPRPAGAIRAEQTLSKRARAPRKIGAPGVLLFLVVSALLVLLLQKARMNPGLLHGYFLAAYSLAGLVWLSTLVLAFRDHWLQGLLMLALPAALGGALAWFAHTPEMMSALFLLASGVTFLYVPLYGFFGIERAGLYKGLLAAALLLLFLEARWLDDASPVARNTVRFKEATLLLTH